MTTITLKLGGMSCQHCVRAVRTALESVDGVELERVDIGTAELRYDAGKTNIAAITDAIADAGYTAEESTAN